MIRLVSDVHGAVDPLRKVVADSEGPLLVLGDLINLIDYRTLEGIATDVSGRDFMVELVRLRTAGDYRASADLWRRHLAGREAELREAYTTAIRGAYEDILPVLDGVEAYVTYGNADRPDMLRDMLPASARYVDAETVVIDGAVIGFVGGGVQSIGAVGEISEDVMADKLDALGTVDILCTHVPPSVDTLMSDVIGGRQKGSPAIRDYLDRARPAFHYFGDVHQPVASFWRYGDTICRNVGFFRATHRAVTHV